MSKILSFEKRQELLRKALSEHTPESLLAELKKYPAYGPSIKDFSPKISNKK